MKKTNIRTAIYGGLSLITMMVANTASGYDGVLDICVNYTTEKKNAEGGTNSIRSKILTSQGIFNRANQDSQISMRVNLLGFNEVGYNPSGKTASQVLSDLRNNAFANIHANRNVRGCDSLALIASIPGCGIAYRPGEYSVTKCLGQHTFAHEIGHNFGCGHGDGHGSGSTPYAEGYTFTGNNGTRYKTIMIGNYDSGATMTYRWSNPDITYQGQPVGTANDNNARRIREVMISHTKRRKVNFLRNDGRWALVNRYSDLVIENPANSQSNGTKLKQWSSGGSHKEWKTRDVGAGGGWLAMLNYGSNKAVDMTGVSTNGRDLHQWSYNINNQNQHFKLDYTDDGYVRIRARNGNRVIHNHGRTKNPGARVTQWSWNGATHMQYELRLIP